MKKFLIIGAGAIGSLYGGKLAQAGAEVSVLCRSDFEFLKNHGISVKSVWGDFVFRPKNIWRDVSQISEKFDFILLATKVLPEISVADLILPVLASDTSIILLQNGIHIEKPITEKFPNHHLISALAFVCVSKISAGNIFHQDYGRLVFGDFPSGVTQKTLQLFELFQKASVPCELSPEIQIERWKKLVWNAPFNPISVLLGGVDTQKILANAATQDLVRSVMQEVCVLAKADGCELPSDIAEKNIEATKKMTPYKTSMLLDFEAKRPMEVGAILGNAIRFAASKNIAVPHLKSLYALLAKR